MNKIFKYYGILWTIALIAFNLVTFLLPSEIMGIDRFAQPTFWVGYAFITITLLFQLLCTTLIFAKRVENSTFLRLPLLNIGKGSVLIAAAVGSVFMVIPTIPVWIGIAVCLAITVVYGVGGFKYILAVGIVSSIEKKVEKETSFIRFAIVTAENLLARAPSEMKNDVKKVYEELKYSDARSSTELKNIEKEIEKRLDALKSTIQSANAERMKSEVDELLILIQERSSKCKLLK